MSAENSAVANNFLHICHPSIVQTWLVYFSCNLEQLSCSWMPQSMQCQLRLHSGFRGYHAPTAVGNNLLLPDIYQLVEKHIFQAQLPFMVFPNSCL